MPEAGRGCGIYGDRQCLDQLMMSMFGSVKFDGLGGFSVGISVQALRWQMCM